jgi:hypothetical protein
LDASAPGVEAITKVPSPSPRKGPSPSTTTSSKRTKKPHPSPKKVHTQGGVVEDALTKVSRMGCDEPMSGCRSPCWKKLLIFYVHGTLLDYSLLAERNTNSRIQYTWKTATGRVVCRPWMKEFLVHCFIHFNVAFWDSKSAAYVTNIVPALMAKLTVETDFRPRFVWSDKE